MRHVNSQWRLSIDRCLFFGRRILCGKEKLGNDPAMDMLLAVRCPLDYRL